MIDICYFSYEHGDCESDRRVVSVKGYTSNVDINRFFTDVAEKIAFDDCTDVTVVEIVWHGKRVFYDGWRRGMYFGFSDESGKCVWGGSFPQWDH